MDIVFFVVDRNDQFQRVPRHTVESLWWTGSVIEELDVPLDDELRLVSVLVDGSLAPRMSFFARLNLDGGRITDESRVDAYRAMASARRRRYDRPEAHHQLAGWPTDWRTQLAVALDVPAADLTRIGIGGPLLMSDLWGIPIDQILDFFEKADG